MFQAHKTSFLIILALLFLLPLIFVPGGALFLESAKAALLVFGLSAVLLVFFFELWRAGSLNFPRHSFLAAAAAIPLVYLLSALLTTPTSLSLFGYSFEVGTFGYMLIGSALLILCSMLFVETGRALQALVAFFFSFSLLALFVAIKVAVGGDFLALGQFFTNMGNPLGNWTDLAVVFGLLALFSALTLGMLPMRAMAKGLLYVVFFLSAALLVIINFSTALIFALIGSVLLLLYFSKVESNFYFLRGEMGQKGEKGGEMGQMGKGTVILPLLLAVASLIFLINPGNVGDTVARTFNIQNAEVRPSFSATLSISKAVLSQAGLLGSGPNTFGHDWLIYKPVDINATPFWAVAFPFGVGFVPTQVASTGILGTAAWLAFFALLIVLAVKALSHIPESRAERFVLVSTLLASLFLWAASFLYAPSGTVLMLAFIFSGLFVASLARANVISTRTVSLRGSPQARFFSVLALLLAVVGSAALGWTGFEKTASAYHWKKAIDLSNSAGTPLTAIESELVEAIQRSPADIYYVALARLNFATAQMAANAATGTPEQNQAIFEDSLRRSIAAARFAVNVNPAGYENWIALGNIYAALVPEPLKVEGAYENAQFAYNEAYRRNPNNPELPLLLARLELNRGNAEAARGYIRSAIALKEDYADAYLMLAQLEVQAGNSEAAINSAEVLALLRPDNPGIHFELGLLKYSGRDYAGAVESLNKALALSPDYANARYYLGLTFAELGRLAEAQAEFEELSRTNPDNPEVSAALEALRKGKKPVSPR